MGSAGQVAVTLTAAGPPADIVMGVGVGTPSGSSCSILQGASHATSAGTTAQVTGDVSPGVLCVVVYDVGNESAPVSYTVTVAHP